MHPYHLPKILSKVLLKCIKGISSILRQKEEEEEEPITCKSPHPWLWISSKIDLMICKNVY